MECPTLEREAYDRARRHGVASLTSADPVDATSLADAFDKVMLASLMASTKEL